MYFLLFLLHFFEPPKYYKDDIGIWSLYMFILENNYLVYCYKKKPLKREINSPGCARRTKDSFGIP